MLNWFKQIEANRNGERVSLKHLINFPVCAWQILEPLITAALYIQGLERVL